MKIIIPVVGKDKKIVNKSMGRAPMFYTYDLDEKIEEYIENSAISSPGGAGIKAAQTIIDSNSNILIAPKIGKNAKDVLDGSDIKIYKTISEDVDENIKSFLDNKLNLLTEVEVK